MARCRQIARKATGAKPPRLNLDTKETQLRSMHRWRMNLDEYLVTKATANLAPVDLTGSEPVAPTTEDVELNCDEIFISSFDTTNGMHDLHGSQDVVEVELM